MKKLFAIATAAIFAMSLNATKVTFDFSSTAGLTELGIALPDSAKGTNLSGTPLSLNGVTLTFAKVNSNDSRVWNSKNDGKYDFRTYANNTLTFAAAEDITAIEFVDGTVGFSEFTGKTWAGTPAKSVTLTANTTNKNITKIIVTVGEAAGVWVPDTVTVAEANELIAGNDAHDHYVKGVVMCQPFCTYAFKDKISFWMHDATNPSDTIEFYDGNGVNNQKWASFAAATEEIRVGDTVLVYAGALASYTNATTNVTITEITGGFYASKLGANQNPVAIVLDTVTVAQAVEIAKTLTPASGKSLVTGCEYVVGGYVIKIKDAAAKTYFMHDMPNGTLHSDFQAYQCATIDRDVDSLDYVYVRGQIMNYNGGSYSNYEISKGTLVHGEPIAIEMDTINVAQAIAISKTLENNASTTDNYVVAGYVKKAPQWNESYKNIGFYMVDNSGDAEDLQVRQGVIDEAVGPVLAIGDHVLVCGQITNNYYEGANNAQIFKGMVTRDWTAAIENILTTGKFDKVIINGVVYVVREGKLYDMMGNQVK